MKNDLTMTRLGWWREFRCLTNEQLGALLQRSAEQARRNCLPKSATAHRRPGPDASDRIHELTHGLIHAGNYAELITEAEAKTMMAEFAAREARAGQVAS